MGVSIRAYARHRGVADNAVRKAIKAGRIQLNKDKTIDVTQADLDWEQNTDPAKANSSKTGSVKTDSAKRPPLNTSPQRTSNPGSALSGSASNSNSYAQVRIAHEVAKTGLARQRLQEKKGQLINKDMVKAQIFRLGRQFRDAWISWPSRVAAQMAVELQVDEHLLHLTLERYVREHLSELGDAKLNVE